MEAPRPARPDEYGAAMAFIDRVFRPGQRGRCILGSQYPHAYRQNPEYARRILLAMDQGRIAGCLAIHPVVLRVDGAGLSAGGIGAVGVDPARRREGIMSVLLEDAVDRMRRAGHLLSVLGGDRRRYGWFGWENAGTRTVFTITPRSIGRPSPAERRLRLEPLDPNPARCRSLQQLGLERPFGVERPLCDIAPLFCRRGRDTWLCRQGRRWAYLVLTGGRIGVARPYERIDEAGGDPELVRSMVRLVLARHRRPSLAAVVGPNPLEVALYEGHSSSWSRTTDGMVKILDLSGLVRALAPQLRRRARRRDLVGRFHLTMRDSGQEAVLELGQRPTRRLVLDDRAMVRLFFGVLPLAETLPAADAFGLGAVLPLPLFIPPLNHT